ANAQREVGGAQTREHLAVHPRDVAELECSAGPVRQEFQKLIEHREVLAEVGRQLKEDRAELRSQRHSRLEKVLQQIRAVAEPGDVGDALGCLECQAEAGRGLTVPASEDPGIRNAVEGVVDLYGGEALGV